MDNALFAGPNGSANSFAQLLETVRNDDTLVIPIYLDTEDTSRCRSANCESAKAYRVARSTLSVLADESGGQVYFAKKLKDLEGVYESVLSDLSTIYSLGYEPSDVVKDGTWSALRVEIRGHPDLTAHTRPGYYSKKVRYQ